MCPSFIVMLKLFTVPRVNPLPPEVPTLLVQRSSVSNQKMLHFAVVFLWPFPCFYEFGVFVDVMKGHSRQCVSWSWGIMSFCGLFSLRVRAAVSERWTCWVFTEWRHFQGVYSPVSIGEGLIFSLHALLVKIHKPPRANLTAVPLFLNYFFF